MESQFNLNYIPDYIALENSVIDINNNYQKVVNLSKELDFRLNKLKSDSIFINKLASNTFTKCLPNSFETDNSLSKSVPYANLTYTGTGIVTFKYNLSVNDFAVLYVADGSVKLQWSYDNKTFYNINNYELVNVKTNIIYIKFTLQTATLHSFALFYNSILDNKTENSNVKFKQVTLTNQVEANNYLNLPLGITNINNQVEIYLNDKLLIPDIDYLNVNKTTVRVLKTLPANSVLSFYCYIIQHPVSIDNTNQIIYLQSLLDVYNNSIVTLFNNLKNTANNINKDLTNVNNLITSVQQKANQYQSDTDTINTDLQNQITTINSNLDSIQQSLAGIQSDLDNYINNKRSIYTSYKNTLNTNIDTFNTNFSTAKTSLTNNVNNINLALDNVLTQLTDLQSLTTSVAGKLTGLESSINNLQATLTIINGLNTSIPTNLTALENNIPLINTDLQNKNEELTTQLQQNSDFLDNLNTLYNDTNNNLYKTQDLFTSMFTQIENNSALVNNKVTELQGLPELRKNDIYFTVPEVVYDNNIKYNGKLRVLVLNDYTIQNKQVGANVKLPDGSIKQTYSSPDGLQIPFIQQNGAWIGGDGLALPSAMHYRNPKNYPETTDYIYENQGDGYYWVKDTSGNINKIYCDMTASGGGWLGLQYWGIDNPWANAPYISSITQTNVHLGGNYTVGIGNNSNNYGSLASLIGHQYFYAGTGSDPIFGNSNISLYWDITFKFNFTQVFIPSDFYIIQVGSNSLTINMAMAGWGNQNYNSLALGRSQDPPDIDYYTVMGGAQTLSNNRYILPANTYVLETAVNKLRIGIQYDAPNIITALWVAGNIFVR